MVADQSSSFKNSIPHSTLQAMFMIATLGLQLNEGLRVTVLDLSLAEELNLEALREERAALAPGSLIRR